MLCLICHTDCVLHNGVLPSLILECQAICEHHTTLSYWTGSYNAPSQMLYLGSALGLYFPWDFCLSPGTSALASFPARFVPPSVALLVTIAAVISVFYCFEKRFDSPSHSDNHLHLSLNRIFLIPEPRSVSGMECGPLSYCCMPHWSTPVSLSSIVPPYPQPRAETPAL